MQNLSGNSAVNISGATGLDFGANSGASINTGILNLNGGTLTTKVVQKAGTGATSLYVANFNGGTLKAQTAATATFMSGLSGAVSRCMAAGRRSTPTRRTSPSPSRFWPRPAVA